MNFVAYIITICALICTANCIKCHICSSHTNTECEKIKDNSTLLECPEPGAFCRKTVQKLSDPETVRITRACGTIKYEDHDGDYCMNTNSNFKKQVSCQCFKEGCNTGNSVNIAHVLFLTIVSVPIVLSGC